MMPFGMLIPRCRSLAQTGQMNVISRRTSLNEMLGAVGRKQNKNPLEVEVAGDGFSYGYFNKAGIQNDNSSLVNIREFKMRRATTVKSLRRRLSLK